MTDLFKDIKEGDKVLISLQSNSLYAGNYSFLVKVAVTRTTPSQFMIGDRRYRKSDGIEIGAANYYHPARVYDEAKDETKEYREHLKKVSEYIHTLKLIKKIILPEFSKLEDGQLTMITEYVQQVLTCLPLKK